MLYTLDLTPFSTRRVSFFLAVEKHLLTSEKWADKEFFFIWDKEDAIVCGRHQMIQTEVNTAYSRSIHTPAYRRHSGGGTIYADKGCFMFSFIRRTESREEVFAHSLSLINDAFSSLGIATELSGRNDLIFQGKKFSGNAYYRGKYGSVLHGTLLHSTDIETLVRVITPDNEKLISKGIESVRQRVINMGEYVDMPIYDFMRYLENFIAPEKYYLDMEDLVTIAKYEQQYLSNEWIWGNNPPCSYVNKMRFDFGSVQLNAQLAGEKIKSITMTGDFFTHAPLEPVYQALCGADISRNGIEKALKGIALGDYILGAENDIILKLFQI